VLAMLLRGGVGQGSGRHRLPGAAVLILFRHWVVMLLAGQRPSQAALLRTLYRGTLLDYRRHYRTAMLLSCLCWCGWQDSGCHRLPGPAVLLGFFVRAAPWLAALLSCCAGVVFGRDVGEVLGRAAAVTVCLELLL
jgi:hypothetical protein